MVPRDGAAAAAPVAESRPDIVAQLPERLPPAGRATTSARASTAASARSHTVKPGETLWGVARRYGVTVPALAAENGMTSQSQLVAGSRLKIPGARGTGGADAPAAESSRMTYKVRRGDTLTEIAQRFNVSVQQLKAWNQIRQSSSLKAGQKIVVYVDPRRVSGG
jgi:LysM repeat protein